MSSPQQPWSPGQAGPSAPPGYGASPSAPAPSTPQGYGAPRWYEGPQAEPQLQPQGQQPYGGGATGELVINLKKPVGAMGMISPVVTIDGYPAPCSWGRNAFPAPAGVRRVDVAQTYLWTYGRASMPVTVTPGATTEVYYAGPMATMLAGAIGLQPQQRPGRAFFIGIMVFVAVVLLVGILAAVIGNLS